MDPLSDDAIRHLRTLADWPDIPGERYRILEQVGRGGMGSVYLAEDTLLERQVAIKVLSLPNTGGTAGERMLREARILGQLEHPGIVPVHDAGVLEDGRVFYAMKLVRGTRLDSFVAEGRPMRERLRVFLRACETVAFAHSHGIVHRDLKPENIMVGPFGEVLVLDWGMARALESEDTTSAAGDGTYVRSSSRYSGRGGADASSFPEESARSASLGTPGYMAPEQERGDVGPRTDVFGLGALLRFLITAGDSSREPTPWMRRLDAIQRKATRSEPEDRYTSVIELATDVTRLLGGEPVSAYREGLLERAAQFIHRHQVPILLVLAYLFMRALLILFTS
jgi:serine/threonine protein kinase